MRLVRVNLQWAADKFRHFLHTVETQMARLLIAKVNCFAKIVLEQCNFNSIKGFYDFPFAIQRVCYVGAIAKQIKMSRLFRLMTDNYLYIRQIMIRV